jgi:hypothetical protein
LGKSDAAEFITFAGPYLYAESAQRIERFRRHSFATGFFNRRCGAVSEDYAETFLPCGDSGGETRGATAYDEYICTLLRRDHSSAFLAAGMRIA